MTYLRSVASATTFYVVVRSHNDFDVLVEYPKLESQPFDTACVVTFDEKTTLAIGTREEEFHYFAVDVGNLGARFSSWF